MRVDQEPADAVVELLRDGVILVREEEAGDVGGRHRVVGRRQGDVGQWPVAELGAAVAALADGSRRAAVVERDREPDREHAGEGGGGGRDRDPVAPAARELGAVGTGLRRRSDQAKQLLDSLVDDLEAGRQDGEVERRVAVEDDE